MGAIRWLARQSMYWMIVWMRQPNMRRAHMLPLRFLDPSKHERFLENYRAQNRFARRIGVGLMMTLYLVIAVALMMAALYQFAMFLHAQGMLIGPDSIRERAADRVSP